MPKFTVQLTDWVRTSLELEVEASTPEEAARTAVELADSGDYSWENTWESQGETEVDAVLDEAGQDVTPEEPDEYQAAVVPALRQAEAERDKWPSSVKPFGSYVESHEKQ